MNDIVNQAVRALDEKLGNASFDGSAKFFIEGEGNVIIDSDGVRSGDEDTDVTLIANVETFQEILSGELDPTSAFMGGRLSVEGDMSTAMRLSSLF